MKLFPSYSKKDLNNLGKIDKVIIGIRYALTRKMLN